MLFVLTSLVIEEEHRQTESVQMVTLSVTRTEFNGQGSGEDDIELVGMSAGNLELARGIEPPTCGLQITC